MGDSRFKRETLELLSRYATEVRRSRHGTLYRLPGGRIVMVGVDHPGGDGRRGNKNELAKVRRALADAGFALDSGVEDDEAGEEAGVGGEVVESNGMVGRVGVGGPLAYARPAGKLLRAGVYVQRRKRVLEIEEEEATVDLPALARELGLAVAEGAIVTARDANGIVLSGPLTLVVETSSEREERVS